MRASRVAIFPVLLHQATGSYAIAGLAAAAQSLATGGGGIVVGHLADRGNIRPVGVLMAAANATAVVGSR
ncbi:hypothetical protein [Micromonospora aurantiaca (nom. illeg.)]|uniref:hypothetical protein n=1 Tax=Micromonospora aurantiaca (nom. illeg.) TaxID=47850 RepID=UPI0035B1DBD0